jgi:hypothetical protein
MRQMLEHGPAHDHVEWTDRRRRLANVQLKARERAQIAQAPRFEPRLAVRAFEERTPRDRLQEAAGTVRAHDLESPGDVEAIGQRVEIDRGHAVVECEKTGPQSILARTDFEDSEGMKATSQPILDPNEVAAHSLLEDRCPRPGALPASLRKPQPFA